jgi:two-component system, OmpR family, sensor histidine kinase AdeS
MKSLRSQITALAIAISVFAALVAAYAPHYVYATRDYFFAQSLTESARVELANMVQTEGKCSPKVERFKNSLGAEQWELNYGWALFALIALSAGAGALVASKLAGSIVAPIRALSDAASDIAQHRQVSAPLPSAVRSDEVRALVDNFSQMRDALARSNDDLRLRSEGIAHELRTPLSVLRARLVGIQAQVLEADAANVDAMLRQVVLIDRISEDLRLLCDTQAQWLQLERTQLRIDELLHAAVDSFQPMAQAAEVQIQLLELEPIIASADAVRLERALGNLLENAVRHAQCRTVQISLKQQNALLEICVDDDGLGWPVAEPENLKRAFVTGLSAQSGRSRSTGLGLAIVEAIIRAHGGQMRMEKSELGGARVVLQLPLSNSTQSV